MAGGWGGAREGAGRPPAGYEPPAERLDLDKVRADHERVKMAQREFKLAVERGQYISRVGVQQAAATMIALFTQTTRAIPDNLERTLALEPKVIEEVGRQLDEALAALAAGLKSLAPEPPADG